MGPLGILLVVVAIFVLMIISIYNTLVKLKNNRENAFADIDVQLKQRGVFLKDPFFLV